MRKQRTNADIDFQPADIIRKPHVQSILASSKLRVLHKRFFLIKSKPMIVDTSAGTKLLAFYSQHHHPIGLIILLHGWEGSSSSAYMIDAGAFYYRRGYSICRLNLRDHGDSHHLNEGLFHGALLEETFDAVHRLSKLADGMPVHLIGFSMGGNFALRIARKYSALPDNHLQSVFAISPPLDPYKTTLAIDQRHAFYRRYFLNKWKNSLRKKQKLFPHKYDFRKMLNARTCMELTEAIMPYFPEFSSYRDYFNLYTLKKDFFGNFRVPVKIFIAKDDPVIPQDDFDTLPTNEYFEIFRLPYGGHCGFIDIVPPGCFYNKIIAEIIG